MPIYEYVCKACGHEAEIMHKISDPAPKKCPECGKPRLAKQMSATGFRLAGGGYYETDFKSGSKKPEEKKPEAKAEVKTESKTESKTEKKADSKPTESATTN